MKNVHEDILFLLNKSYELALQGNIKDAVKIKKGLSDIHSVSIKYPYLICALTECIGRTLKDSNVIQSKKVKHIGSEYSLVHTWVRNNKDNFGDIEVIDKFSSLESGRRPDFLFMKNNIKYPVECKKYFRDKSVNQLREYMKEMGVKIGYAVACEFKVDQPDDIIFIKCE